MCKSYIIKILEPKSLVLKNKSEKISWGQKLKSKNFRVKLENYIN